MYVPENNFSPRDYAVSRAINELHEQYEYITGEMIAEHTGYTIRTVYKSLVFMKDIKWLIHHEQTVKGSRYEYVGER